MSEWQVTLCDPIWRVTSRSCEMGVPLTAIHCFFTLFYDTHHSGTVPRPLGAYRSSFPLDAFGVSNSAPRLSGPLNTNSCIGVEDGGRGTVASHQKYQKNIFCQISCKFGRLVNFPYIYFRAIYVLPLKLTELYAYDHDYQLPNSGLAGFLQYCLSPLQRLVELGYRDQPYRYEVVLCSGSAPFTL